MTAANSKMQCISHIESKKDVPFQRKYSMAKLPWLTNEAVSRPVPEKALDGAKTEGSSPSPTTRPTSNTLSPMAPSKRLATDSPTSSATGDSLSPVSRHRLSQARRESVAQQAILPPRHAHRPSASHEPGRRLSVFPHHNDGDLTGGTNESRPRADSIAPMPDHLELPESDTSDSENDLSDSEIPSTNSPAIVSRVQMSPSQPKPGRNAFERAGHRRISSAIEDLENMVQEAVEAADKTADSNQVEEIYNIIEHARTAIYDAADPAHHLMETVSPLKVSSLEDYEDTPESSSCSSGSSRRRSLGRSPPPVLILPKDDFNHVPPETQTDPQRESVSFDWAYTHQTQPRDSSSSSEAQGHSRFSTTSDLLLPPAPTQTAPREHVDFVLRPHACDEYCDRTRSRPAEGIRTHRHRHRHRLRSHSSGSSDSCGKRKHQSSGFNQLDASLDEEEVIPQRYGNKLSIREQASRQTFSLRRHHRRQPIARNWSTGKKRFTAAIACINTALLGIIVGVYSGSVPRIQYYLADERHIVIVGNAILYFALALSTFVVWPLPLLHGRKPYLLAALALALPLQFPQAIVISGKRSPNDKRFRTGLLCARAASGLVLGFANVNYITVLLDLFGASLQSKNPHQEFVVANDVRRHGGGMGMWLGIWSWCWIGSLAVGFQIGAVIIERLTPDWGFYAVVMILAVALILNIVVPETRRAAYRKSVTEVYDRDENYITRRVSRGECKLHISTEGPKYWFEEVWAGMKLVVMMMCQPGFFVLSLYLGWIYAQIVLVIVLLGALLSREYKWQPRLVGAGVMSIAIGAFLAIPLTKAGIFSRDRKNEFRTDSMTFQKQVTWSSHLIRRAIFTLTLPLMGLAYTISSAGAPKPYMVPIVFAGAVGFLSILAIAECHGLIMETFDTCDLQPGVNTRHRLESMAVQDRRRRTNYTSFPRVTAGIFASQTLAFIGAGVATMVGGSMTRRLGAQTSTGVTAGILLGLTIFLTAALIRFKEIQVIPNHTFGTRRDTAAWQDFKDLEKAGKGADWKAVVIGTPSGKMRRMNVLELGALSRWTEIRKLNFLIRGPRLGEERKKRTLRGGW